MNSNSKFNGKNYQKIIEKYNSKLKAYNQKIYVKFLDQYNITFSNNKSFDGSERKRWMIRLNTSSIIMENFDDIINDKININDIRSKICSDAAKLCWDKNRDQFIEQRKGRKPWNIGLPKEMQPFYGRTQTDEVKSRISSKNKGKNNGMYGKPVSKEQKQIQSVKIKDKILNGEFTPNTNNRNTYWDSKLDGISYRSSWECLYKHHNPNSLYEKLRIKYVYDNKERIYIVDFIDEINKLAIEIKPNNILKQDISKAKIDSLREWCRKNDYSILIVNEEWLIKNIKENSLNYDRFDIKTQTKIKKFYETNKKN